MKLKIDSDRPLVIVCKSPSVERLEIEGAITIDKEAARYHGTRVSKLHKATEGLLALMERRDPLNEHDWQTMVGFIDLTLKLMDKYPGIKIHWQHPEEGLHPSHQCELGDVARHIAMGTIYEPSNTK